MSKLTSSFVLNTYNATTKDNLNTTFTWTNIDLKEILKDEWNHYERFKLIISEIGYSTNSLAISQDSVLLNIAGLPFENCNYIIGSQNALTNYTALCPMTFIQNGGILQYGDYTGVIFNKNQHLVNLNIFAILLQTGIKPTGTLPDMTFLFHIVGVE